MTRTNFARAAGALQGADLSRRVGKVSDLIGLIIEATGVQVEIGEVCMVGDDRSGRGAVPTEVVGFRGGRTLLMPLGELHGIGPGTSVYPTGGPFRVAVGESSTASAIRSTVSTRPRACPGAVPRPRHPIR